METNHYWNIQKRLKPIKRNTFDRETERKLPPSSLSNRNSNKIGSVSRKIWHLLILKKPAHGWFIPTLFSLNPHGGITGQGTTRPAKTMRAEEKSKWWIWEGQTKHLLFPPWEGNSDQEGTTLERTVPPPSLYEEINWVLPLQNNLGFFLNSLWELLLDMQNMAKPNFPLTVWSNQFLLYLS